MVLRRLALSLAMLSLAAGTASAASPEQRMLQNANKLRASLGMATLTTSAEYSRGCELHNRYIRLTKGGDANAHEETPGRRGYTTEGHVAGLRSNLAGASRNHPNPWINAPYHLAGMIDPGLRTTGIAFDQSKFGNQWCMWVSSNMEAPPTADRFFSYPRDGGKAPRAQIASEYPSVPAYDVGLKTPSKTLSSRTGPNIIVFQESIEGYEHCRMERDDDADFPTFFDRRTGQPVDASQCGELVLPVDLMTSAKMTGPKGPVTVRTHDKDHPMHHHRRGIIVPVKPLEAGGRYTVSVTFSTDLESGGGEFRSVTNTFSFTATKKTLR